MLARAFTLFLISALIGAHSAAVEPVDRAASAPVAQAPGAGAVPVLLQLALTVDGQAADALASLRFYVAPLDLQTPPRRVTPQPSVSPQAAQDGWVTLPLEPGNHFLLVVPPGLDQGSPAVAYHVGSARFGRLVRPGAESTGGMTRLESLQGYAFTAAAPDQFEVLDGFLLRVPPGAPAAYAGTFSIECTGGAGSRKNPVRVCSDVSVADRSDEAAAVTLVTPAGAVPPVPSPVTPYGTALAALELRGEGPTAVIVRNSVKPLATDFRANPASIPFVIVSPDPVANLFNLFALAGKGLTDAQRARAASAEAEKWRPCLAQLASQVSGADLEAIVRDSAEAALKQVVLAVREQGGVAAAGPGREVNLMVELAPQQLGLVPCHDTGLFCLELGARVSLTDLARQQLLLDAAFVRTGAAATGDPEQGALRLAQLYAGLRLPGQKMEAWCGTDSAAKFRAEVEQAVATIMRSALRRAMGP